MGLAEIQRIYQEAALDKVHCLTHVPRFHPLQRE